jgi:hypothetical protein
MGVGQGWDVHTRSRKDSVAAPDTAARSGSSGRQICRRPGRRSGACLDADRNLDGPHRTSAPRSTGTRAKPRGTRKFLGRRSTGTTARCAGRHLGRENQVGEESGMLYIIAGISVAALLGIVVLGVALGYDLVELTFHPPIFVKLKLTRTNRHLASLTPWLDRTRPWYTRLAIMANPARRRSPTWSPPPAGTTFSRHRTTRGCPTGSRGM